MSNFDDLREQITEARQAMARVRVPTTDDSANPYAALYYPMLFLTETATAALRHALRDAHTAVAEENRGAAEFLAKAKGAQGNSAALARDLPAPPCARG